MIIEEKAYARAGLVGNPSDIFHGKTISLLFDRFEVKVSPFQDDNWLRQLFSPTLVDWLADESPLDFSFELAYGSLFCTIEADDPDQDELAALWDGAATVARRIHEESHE